ncbi:MAG: hypothetical protein NTY43_07340 [Bacteroidetes bacterium]|nr:hypothetical protein [Bacteroidota bacterium]
MTLMGIKPLASLLITMMHPFFISVIEINHNEKDASLEISVRTFTDDLEKTINKENHTTIDFNNPQQKEKADLLIKEYVIKKLLLVANGSKCNFNYIGFEIQKESVWSYFEVKNIKELKQLNVLCDILSGINDQQINIVHVKTKGQRKSYELALPKNTTQFNF